MKQYRWLLSGVLLAALALAPALASEDAGGKAKRGGKRGAAAGKDAGKKRDRKGTRGAQQDLLAQIKEACSPTADQVTQLELLIPKYNEAKQAAVTNSADTRKQLAEARKNKDKDKAKELAPKMAEFQAPVQQALAAVLGVLTADQRTAWEAYGLKTQVLKYFAKAELTEEQKTAIDKQCKEQAVGLKDADEKSKRATLMSICKDVYGKLLTEDQKTKVKEPAGRGLKGTKEGKAGKAAGGRKKKGAEAP